MRKLKLELDSLQVESFRTSNGALWRGTIDARSEAEPEPQVDEFTNPVPAPPPDTQPPAASCDTCHYTCVTNCSCRTMPCDTCT